jgi:ABC-type branched-subunit amino acid transport system substrate-binding protein
LLAAVALAAAACTGGDSVDTNTVPQRDIATSTTVAPPVTTQAPSRFAAEIRMDGVTVTDDTIYLGVLADLSGPFSGLVVDIVDAQLAFWSDVNDHGGIAGRQIELMISDTGYDVARHEQRYAALKDHVVMFAHSTGSAHTAAIADDLVADHRLATVATWYSGWADPALGANVLETGSNYCMEAMNALSYVAESHEAQTGSLPKVAIVTDAGDYGQDSAAGAKLVLSSLGDPVAFDGEGAITPGVDLAAIGAAIAQSGADWSWLATDPTSAASIVRSAIQQGYAGQWSGAMPSFSTRLLDSALGDYLSQTWLMSALFTPMGADVDGMSDVYDVLAEAFPARYPSDALVKGYLEFSVVRAVLERAAELGDMTPKGLETAAASIGSYVFAGLSPANVYSGNPNDAVTRASALYRPSKELFDEEGGLGATLGAGATSPFVPVEGFFVSEVAADYTFSGPCYSL